MKCLLTADIHLGIQKNDELWLEQTKRLFKTIIDECHRRDVYTLCILGDIFHDRRNIGVKTLLTALEIADMLKQNCINVFMLIGNHDTFFKTEIETNTLRIFDEYDNIEIIRESKVISDVGFVSWNQNIDLDTDYLFGHFEINGFPVTDTMIFEKSVLNASDFSKYKKVISGHFHIPSQKHNITYLGTPYPLTFNDVGSLRGYYYFDDGELEFIEFDGVKFVKITTEETPNPKKIEGNIVKLIFEKDYGTVENNKKIDKIQSFSPLRFFTDFTNISKEIKTEKIEIDVSLKTNEQILHDFISVSDIPEHLDPKRLKLVIKTLIQGGE